MGSREAGIDHGTGAFRRLLGEAGGSEQARVDALLAFSQRVVLAATWPGQNQTVRTLTNRDGETAMPLFTGLDVLEETATRFGWRNPDGSLPMREMAAREALIHALARGVHFVVVDIGSDHAVEFGRMEIDSLLSLSPQGNVGAFAGSGETQAQVRDAVRRSSRPPAVAGEIDPPFAELKTGANPKPTAPARAVSQTRLEVAPRRAPSQPLGPNATVIESAALSQPMPGARPPSQPMPGARPPSQPMPGARPPSQPMPGARAMSQPMPGARAMSQPMPGARALSQPMPGARPLSQQNMPAVRPGSQQNMEAVDPEPQPATGSLTNARPPSVRPPTHAAPAAAATESAPESDEDRESGERSRELAAGSLPEPLLQAMSAGMRGYPEVEWACVLTDGSDLPVIGLRVDPSFLNRVAQITDAIFEIGAKSAQEVQVLLLNTPELVKSAHKNGRAFYPWKR